jgi:hypothetical protein
MMTATNNNGQQRRRATYANVKMPCSVPKVRKLVGQTDERRRSVLPVFTIRKNDVIDTMFLPDTLAFGDLAALFGNFTRAASRDL